MRKIIVGSLLPDEICGILSEYGKVIRIPESDSFSSPVSGHPDILIGKVGDSLFVSESDKCVRRVLEENGIAYSLSEKAHGNSYPDDCSLNFFTVGNHLVGKEDILSTNVLETARSKEYIIINVKQGYSKCSTVVCKGCIITADRGIYDSAVSIGTDALLIEAGCIELPPYSYGFIGGASAVIDNTIVFFGDITKHGSFSEIEAFCRDRGIIIKHTDGALSDYGGAVIV